MRDGDAGYDQVAPATVRGGAAGRGKALHAVHPKWCSSLVAREEIGLTTSRHSQRNSGPGQNAPMASFFHRCGIQQPRHKPDRSGRSCIAMARGRVKDRSGRG